jgi:hypothetical protein
LVVQDDVARPFLFGWPGAEIAIKVAAPPASLVVEPAQDQSKTEPAFALNESAKSDRLELPNARAEPEIIVPAAKPTPAEIPSTSQETVKKATGRHWQNANASIIPVVSPRRHTKKAKNRSKAQANPSRTKEPRSGTADRTPWAVF